MRKNRSDVALKETWDLTDLFATDQDWEEALTSIQNTTKNVTAYKGRLTESPATLLQALQTYEKFQEQVIRVATYANLKVNTDGGDPTNQANATKIAATIAKVNAELSFIESELLATDQAIIDQYLQEETDLKTYRIM